VRPPLIVLLCALIFTTTFPIGAFPALLPELGRAGLADWALGLVAGAFGLARLVADVPVGLFLTHHLRRALVLGPLLISAGVLLLASDGPLAVLALGRACQGVGHALTIVAGLTAILRYQATGALGAALGAYELAAMLGMLGGTVALGLLPTGLAWPAAFLLACAPQGLGLLVAPAVLAALPPAPSAGRAPLFARGARTTGRAAPVTRPVVLAFGAGAAIALAYATLEQFVIPLRAGREFGLGRAGVARLLALTQVVDIACLVPFGALADRRGVRPVLGAVLLAFALGVGCVAFGDFPLLVLGCGLFGVGMAGWTLPLGLLRAATPPEQIGWRTALYRLGVDGGIFLGPTVAGLLSGTAPGALAALEAVALALVGLAVLAEHRARGG